MGYRLHDLNNASTAYNYSYNQFHPFNECSKTCPLSVLPRPFQHSRPLDVVTKMIHVVTKPTCRTCSNHSNILIAGKASLSNIIAS